MFGAYLPETSQITPDGTLVFVGMLYHPVNTLKLMRIFSGYARCT